jgi:acid phosphatase class B
MKTKRTLVCDLDGTIADNKNRQQYLRNGPKNWKAYNAAMADDGVYWDIVNLVQMYHDAGWTIVFVTAREGSPKIKEMTMDWLTNKAKVIHLGDKVVFRGDKDYRDDSVVKKEILDTLRSEGYDVQIALDDRDRVVAMWRENGVRCLQVQPGEF